MKPQPNLLNSEILSFTKEARFTPGQHLPIWQNWAWLIQTGVVKTYTWNEQGHSIILGYWGSGELVGQPLSPVSPYKMQCCTPVEVQQVPPTLWSSWGEYLCQHCQQSKELLLISHCKPLRDRLRRFLMWLAQKLGEPVDRGWQINFKLTHQELAEAIGSSRVTVTKLLRELEQQGDIKRISHYRGFIVKSSTTVMK